MAGRSSPRSSLGNSSSGGAPKEQVLQDVLHRQAEQMQQFEKLLKKLPGQVRTEQRRRLEQLRFGQDNVMEALNFLVGSRSPASSCRSCSSRGSGMSKVKNQRRRNSSGCQAQVFAERRRTSNGNCNGSQLSASPWASSTRTPQRGSSAPSSPSSISRSGRQSPSRRDCGTPWQKEMLPRRESSKSSRGGAQQSRASSESRIQPGTVLYRSPSVHRNSFGPSSSATEQVQSPGCQSPRHASPDRRRSPSPLQTPPPQRTAPGQQLLEWEQSKARSSESSSVSLRRSPRLQPTIHENSATQPAVRKSTSVPSLGKRSASCRGDGESDFWDRLHKHWTDPQSPQSARPSRGDDMESMENQSWSSCPSTPAAGDHVTQIDKHAHGRAHYDIMDHITSELTTLTCKPGGHMHGHHGGLDDFDGDLERYIGHGRRKFPDAHHNHLRGVAALPQKSTDARGSHGHSRDEDACSDGLPWCIGHGRAKVIDHVKDHLWEEESQGGEHGHSKHDGCVGGLSFEIGHGRRKVKVDHRVGWPGGELDCSDLPAGMSSRDIEVVRRPRDPTHNKATTFRER